jgi:hypothetical protein
MKWSEVMAELGVGRAIFLEMKHEYLPNRKAVYTTEDVELLRNVLKERTEKKQKEKEDKSPRIEPAGENEYYAKVIKDEKVWSVGTFSSTNLQEDLIRFKRQGLELKVIDEKEAQKIYKEMFQEWKV